MKRHWLTKYKGLSYSKSVDGEHFKYYILFAQTEVSKQRLGMLVNKLLKHASNVLTVHFNRKSHICLQYRKQRLSPK